MGGMGDFLGGMVGVGGGWGSALARGMVKRVAWVGWVGWAEKGGTMQG